MEQRKNTKVLKILIITISILILVLIGIVAYLYFQTDLLRSDKELFFKYIAQMGDTENGFIDNQIMQYFSKKENTPYTNDGTIRLKMESRDIDEQTKKSLDDFNISFNGKVDTLGNKSEQEISLNYSDDVKFPIIYRQIKETLGLKTEFVSKSFIAIDTNNTSTLPYDIASTINQVKSILEKAKETEQVEMTEQEKQIINKYFQVLNQSIDKSKFSKVEESNSTGYKLILTEEDFRNIIVKLLETLKDDQIALDKINEYMQKLNASNTIEKSVIENLIEELNNTQIENSQQFEITVYNKNKKTNKLKISAGEVTITLEKIKGSNQTSISISLNLTTGGVFADDNKEMNLLLAVNLTGLETMQNVKEDYQITFKSGDESGTYQIGNAVNFAQNVDIEEFSEENSLVLNDFEEEQVTNFLENVIQRIEEVNKQQMEELGLKEDENPLFYMTLSGLSRRTSTLPDTQMNEMMISTFNATWSKYEGTQAGVTVKGLMTELDVELDTENIDSYKEYGLKIEEINFNGEEYEATRENIAFIKEEMSLEKEYRVEFESKEDTGAIYRIVINEK